MFYSDGKTWKTITIAYGIFEHAQEPVEKMEYNLDPLFRPSHKLVVLFSLRLYCISRYS